MKMSIINKMGKNLYIHAINRAVKITNHLHTVPHSNMADTHEHHAKQEKQVTEELFNLHTVKNSIYIEFKNMQHQTMYCLEMQIYVLKP